MGRRILALALLSACSIAQAQETSSTSTPAEIAESPEVPEKIDRLPVEYRHQAIFYLEDDHTPRGKRRATRFSEALAQAIERPDVAAPGSADAELRPVGSSSVALYVRGHFVGELGERDARASGHPNVAAYSRDLEGGLSLFTADQRRRAALQTVALHVFLAGLFLVVGLVAFQLVRYLFRRADDYLDDRRIALRPIRVLQVPIISAEAIGAMVAFSLAIGRIITYVAIGITSVFLALSQFTITRLWVTAVLSWASKPLVTSLEHLVGALPGLALAVVLVVAAKGALRVIHVLVDGAASGRVRGRTLTTERALVLRTVLSLGVVGVSAPLVIAAVFGRYHTPIEVLVLAGAVAVVVACIPLLATGIVGLAVLWRGEVRTGSFVQVRDTVGKIASVSPWNLEIETTKGSRVKLPMLSLLVTPLRTLEAEPKQSIITTVKRNGDLSGLIAKLSAAVQKIEPSATLSCTAFGPESVRVLIETVSARSTNDVLVGLEELRGEGIEVLEASAL